MAWNRNKQMHIDDIKQELRAYEYRQGRPWNPVNPV
jgi:hypothetical protein